VRLAFFQPDIPQNLGAALRLGACLAIPVDVIEPCGFPLTDKALRRAAMDYAESAVFVRHAGWTAFLGDAARQDGRLVLFTTVAATRLQEFRFEPGDTLLFGRESAGVPPDVHAAADARVVIPMSPGVRSLNVAMAAGVAAWEACRQTGQLPSGSKT
jgi:tRNA (cytidine/uridine-2'-O-)-methyltransferase